MVVRRPRFRHAQPGPACLAFKRHSVIPTWPSGASLQSTGAGQTVHSAALRAVLVNCLFFADACVPDDLAETGPVGLDGRDKLLGRASHHFNTGIE